MTASFKNKRTYSLITMLILIIIIICGFFYFNAFFLKSVQLTDVKIDTKAALKLNVLNQISKKNGIKEWELNAASATLLKGEDKAVLIDVSIIFFTREGQLIQLTSKQGILHTKTHDMIFSDNVVVTYETSVLRTDKLHYNKKEHIIYTNTHVTLEKNNSVIEADSMTTKLNENNIVLKGRVRGNFSENFGI